jgi:simple sugar transport system permease protein
MANVRPLLRTAVLAATPLALALVFTTVVLVLVRAEPLTAYRAMWHGAFGSPSKFADVLLVWAPLVLCASGLLFTFTAGLWNIGIEGQMVFGAIAAAWVARSFDWPAPAMIVALMAAGGVGGALWALLAGALRTYGKVHEIFAGLGLNFVAIAFTQFLIFGPWRQPGMATMSGTEPFRSRPGCPTSAGCRWGR